MACPTCGEGGEYFRATALAERRHFFSRALWAMHRWRQALEALRETEQAREASALILIFEQMKEGDEPGGDA